jgi:UDP-N-acetylmuramoyl-L-alanyl-D-glutamate--2,6-diaminopimelate ligase
MQTLKLILYKLKRPFHFVKTGLLRGLAGELQYGFPAKQLKIIAITGTDGKTTSSTLMYHVLKAAGKKVALVTTVAAYIGDEEIDTGFHVTTPDAGDVQRFLAKMVELGIEYVVLEATSHGMYQHRLWGIYPEIAGFTNITHEHLDYHVTYDEYVAAKALLARSARHIVINADDSSSYRELKRQLANRSTDIHAYSKSDRLPPAVSKAINARFDQPYNQMNARLVYTIAKLMKVEDKAFTAGLREFPGVPGRMQEVGKVKNIKVIVDFAHTPNSLESALQSLRKELKQSKSKGRIIAVFGCAGLRDVQKRPMMGRIGAELADLAIFTAEDPRTEDVWSIIRQMKSDLGTFHNKVVTIADRKEAITYAIQHVAKSGDIIGIFGKGHEKSMSFGTVEYPWSDLTAAQEALLSLEPKKE